MNKKNGNVILITLIISTFLSAITLLALSYNYRYYTSLQERRETLQETIFVESRN